MCNEMKRIYSIILFAHSGIALSPCVRTYFISVSRVHVIIGSHLNMLFSPFVSEKSPRRDSPYASSTTLAMTLARNCTPVIWLDWGRIIKATIIDLQCLKMFRICNKITFETNITLVLTNVSFVANEQRSDCVSLKHMFCGECTHTLKPVSLATIKCIILCCISLQTWGLFDLRYHKFLFAWLVVVVAIVVAVARETHTFRAHTLRLTTTGMIK